MKTNSFFAQTVLTLSSLLCGSYAFATSGDPLIRDILVEKPPISEAPNSRVLETIWSRLGKLEELSPLTIQAVELLEAGDLEITAQADRFVMGELLRVASHATALQVLAYQAAAKSQMTSSESEREVILKGYQKDSQRIYHSMIGSMVFRFKDFEAFLKKCQSEPCVSYVGGLERGLRRIGLQLNRDLKVGSKNPSELKLDWSKYPLLANVAEKTLTEARSALLPDGSQNGSTIDPIAGAKLLNFAYLTHQIRGEGKNSQALALHAEVVKPKLSKGDLYVLSALPISSSKISELETKVTAATTAQMRACIEQRAKWALNAVELFESPELKPEIKKSEDQLPEMSAARRIYHTLQRVDVSRVVRGMQGEGLKSADFLMNLDVEGVFLRMESDEITNPEVVDRDRGFHWVPFRVQALSDGNFMLSTGLVRLNFGPGGDWTSKDGSSGYTSEWDSEDRNQSGRKYRKVPVRPTDHGARITFLNFEWDKNYGLQGWERRRGELIRAEGEVSGGGPRDALSLRFLASPLALSFSRFDPEMVSRLPIGFYRHSGRDPITGTLGPKILPGVVQNQTLGVQYIAEGKLGLGYRFQTQGGFRIEASVDLHGVHEILLKGGGDREEIKATYEGGDKDLIRNSLFLLPELSVSQHTRGSRTQFVGLKVKMPEPLLDELRVKGTRVHTDLRKFSRWNRLEVGAFMNF